MSTNPSVKIKSREEPNSRPVRFRKNGKPHYSVEIFLEEQTPGELDKIEEVIYELHPSFKDQYRNSKSNTSGFKTKIRTYGTFPLTAKLKLKDGSINEINGNLKF